MMNGVRHSWIFDLITMIAVIVGVVYGAVELRNLREARDREALFRLFEISQSEAYAAALASIRRLPPGMGAEQLRAHFADPQNDRDLRYLGSTWEGLGILTFRGHVPLPWVDEYYGGPVLESYQKLRPLLLDIRRSTGRQSIYEWFEWLAEELREYEADGERTPAYIAHRHWKWQD